MIQNRIDIARNHKLIGSELAKFQKLILDTEDLSWAENEAAKNDYLKIYDLLEIPEVDQLSFNKVLSINHNDINSFTKELSDKLIVLLKEIGVEELVVITPRKMDFFGNRGNQFDPLVEAYNKLETLVGSNTFNEAFKIKLADIERYLEIFFWIVRCDPSGPQYFFFYDRDEKIEFNLCKYGNIHLTEFGIERIAISDSFSKNWTEIEGTEFDNFSEDGRIKGRKLKL